METSNDAVTHNIQCIGISQKHGDISGRGWDDAEPHTSTHPTYPSTHPTYPRHTHLPQHTHTHPTYPSTHTPLPQHTPTYPSTHPPIPAHIPPIPAHTHLSQHTPTYPSTPPLIPAHTHTYPSTHPTYPSTSSPVGVVSRKVYNSLAFLLSTWSAFTHASRHQANLWHGSALRMLLSRSCKLMIISERRVQ